MSAGIHKGIVLAGGAGSRLFPLSKVCSKQLMPVYDKPMIYYPLTTLMLSGISEVLLISTPHDLPRFEELLGDGSQWGINIRYIEQPTPGGLAQAFVLGAEFIGNDSVALILGDNIFYGRSQMPRVTEEFQSGGTIFGYPVQDPERYGVIEYDHGTGKALSIEEKPTNPRSNLAVPGYYLFDNQVVEIARDLTPSPRGELEIVSVIEHYMNNDQLQVEPLSRGVAWLDTGLADSLQDASSFIRLIEERQSLKIGCPEEVALRRNLIDKEQFNLLIQDMPRCPYRRYLKGLLKEMQTGFPSD